MYMIAWRSFNRHSFTIDTNLNCFYVFVVQFDYVYDCNQYFVHNSKIMPLRYT